MIRASLESVVAEPRPAAGVAGGGTRPTAGTLLMAAVLLAVVLAPTLTGGGFGARSQIAFILLAGSAAVVVAALDGPEAISGLRVSVPSILATLAFVSVVSALWTVGSPAAAVRWGLVIGGYAVVATVTRAVARRVGPAPIATTLVAIAAAEALVGLDAVAMHSLPYAERLARSWEPGGTFEYQPALALLEVCALPPLVGALGSSRPWVRAPAAAATVLAGAVLGLSGSRFADGLAVLTLVAVLIGALACATPRGAEPRPFNAKRAPIAAALLVALGAVVSPLVLGGVVTPGEAGAGVGGLSRIGAVACAAAGCGAVLPEGWWRRRPRTEAARGLLRTLQGGSALRLLIVAGALATVCVAIATAAPPRPPSVHGGVSGDRAHVAQSSFLHGREQEWVTALQTWLDRPLLGAGAAAYYIASAAHQKVARSLYAHNLPLELAAELGIPGLMLTIALYWQTARAIVQRWRSPVLWMLAPTAAFFLLSNLLDWTWHLAALGAIWAAATGAMLGSPTLPPP